MQGHIKQTQIHRRTFVIRLRKISLRSSLFGLDELGSSKKSIFCLTIRLSCFKSTLLFGKNSPRTSRAIRKATVTWAELKAFPARLVISLPEKCCER